MGVLCILGVFTLIAVTANAQSPRSAFDKLLEGYDRLVRPGDGGPPTPVSVSAIIREIEDVDLHKQTMTFGMTMRYHYEDPRLEHGVGKRLASHDFEIVNRFWMPDLFVRNGLEVDFHDIPHPNALIRIDNRGSVTISRRFQVRVFCADNDLSSFPMDVFRCLVQLSSYGLTGEDINLRLKSVSGGKTVPLGYDKAEVTYTDGTIISLATEPPQEKSGNVKHSQLDSDDKYAVVMAGNYTSLKILVSMNRLRGGFMISTFLPSSTAVILAYLTLWMDPRDLTPRITLNGIMLAALLYLSNSLHLVVPRVPYVTAMDTWIGISKFLITLAIFEGVMVERLVGSGQDAQMKFFRGSTVLWATRIEFGTKVFIPIFYLVFNIGFWAYHLS